MFRAPTLITKASASTIEGYERVILQTAHDEDFCEVDELDLRPVLEGMCKAGLINPLPRVKRQPRRHIRYVITPCGSDRLKALAAA